VLLTEFLESLLEGDEENEGDVGLDGDVDGDGIPIWGDDVVEGVDEVVALLGLSGRGVTLKRISI
jgi:hypothetical protein